VQRGTSTVSRCGRQRSTKNAAGPPSKERLKVSFAHTSAAAAGAGIGLFYGLVFGEGLPRRWMEAIFGPEEKG
jgi:hypothetical protein